MALLPLTDAQSLAVGIVTPGEVELRAPEASFDLFLAQPIRAGHPLPGCDNSAMDGYAVRAEETRGANRDRPAQLKVVGTQFAGHAPTVAVGPGEAVRIFTGAQVPDGADAVVRQEATAQHGDLVSVFVEVSPQDNIRPRGEELREGTQVFARGQRIDAYAAALLASLGYAEVPVFAEVPVAIVTVGDELLEPGQPLAPHQLYESNSKLLAGLVRGCNGVVVSARRAKDDLGTLERVLQESLARADVLITSGGASVGDKDLVKDALRAVGAEFVVDGVAIKPGKPVAVATLGGKLVAVLPGNPGAASVGFDQLVRPMLLARQGVAEVRKKVHVRMDSPRSKQPGMTYLLAARLEFREGVAWARIRPQGAGQLFGNVAMDGWVVLPRGRGEFVEGELVELHLLHGSEFVPVGERLAEKPGIARAVSVVGWSGSGKTTLLEAAVRELTQRGVKVAVMKHSSDSHPLHKVGSDTDRYAAAGAREVAFVTANGAQLTSSREDPGAVLARMQTSDVDLVLVEGWKEGPLPKIEVRAPGAQPIEARNTEAVVEPDIPVAQLVERLLSLGGRAK